MDLEGKFQLRVANSVDGKWPDWSRYFPIDSTDENPGALRITLSIASHDEINIEVRRVADDKVFFIWVVSNPGLKSGFREMALIGCWRGWESNKTSTLLVGQIKAKD